VPQNRGQFQFCHTILPQITNLASSNVHTNNIRQVSIVVSISIPSKVTSALQSLPSVRCQLPNFFLRLIAPPLFTSCRVFFCCQHRNGLFGRQNKRSSGSNFVTFLSLSTERALRSPFYLRLRFRGFDFTPSFASAVLAEVSRPRPRPEVRTHREFGRPDARATLQDEPRA
jgi:hypothetical protein